MKLFDSTLDALSRAMDVRLQRHSVLAGNLANANTPGYEPKDVDFGKALAAVETSAAPAVAAVPAHEGFIPVAGPAAPAAPAALPAQSGLATTANPDGNKVDADRTMVELASNALQYGAAARAAGKKLALLRYVASDGNG